MALKLFNTYTKKKEEFRPLVEGEVSIYACGPTVYDSAHIGNFRSYIFADTLVRVLKYNGYNVRFVQNITDVGHLTNDDNFGDQGDDKIEVRAKELNLKTSEITKKFTREYIEDRRKLELLEPYVLAYATKHIKEQIDFIKDLENKGFTYKTSDGIYFNTSKIDGYGKLGDLDIENLIEGARVEKNPEKKAVTDFALWKFSKTDIKRQQEWKSPWGVGFPGWHIECSAMSFKYLSEHFDIHTGGVDHIPIHHTNEIAQNLAATGSRGANFWMHNAFITVDGKKMSKSLKNTFTISDLINRGYSPMAYKYFLHMAHYRQQENFTWNALTAAETAYKKLLRRFSELNGQGKIHAGYEEKFLATINDDLAIPKSIAIAWELIKDENVKEEDKRTTLLSFDEVLGLALDESTEFQELPSEISKMVLERESARKNKKWDESDAIRDRITDMGYIVEDSDDGPRIYKK